MKSTEDKRHQISQDLIKRSDSLVTNKIYFISVRRLKKFLLRINSGLDVGVLLVKTCHHHGGQGLF